MPRKKSEDPQFLLRIPAALKESLRAGAEREGRTLTSHIVWILRNYVDKKLSR